MASMKPRFSVHQLLWAMALVVVVKLTEVLQLLQPKQESYCLLLFFALPLHHVGFVLLDECLSLALALHRWLSKHPHVQDQPQKMKRNRALSLTLLKVMSLVFLVLQSRS